MAIARKQLDTIPGWFRRLDQELFEWMLRSQVECGERGDLAELGVYLGKSAVVIGDSAQEGERFTVVDLFGENPDDLANADENQREYKDLTQREFEAHYLRFHRQLPTVIKGPSSEILQRASEGRHRFIHIDASHLYHHVKADLRSARTLLQEQGIVVLDDFREPHTPGVAAAAWEAVLNDGLHVLALTEEKLYGTWSAPEAWRTRFRTWLATTQYNWDEQVVAGEPIIRLWTTAPYTAVREKAVSLLPDRVRAGLRSILQG